MAQVNQETSNEKGDCPLLVPVIAALLATVAVLSSVPGCRRPRPATDGDSTKALPAPPLLSPVEIEAAYGTAALANDPDNPAIWVHPTDPSRSLIIGTIKVASPAGAIVVFDMSGRIRQIVSNIDRPNNVDVEYGFRLSGRDIDIVVVTERLKQQLRNRSGPRRNRRSWWDSDP